MKLRKIFLLLFVALLLSTTFLLGTRMGAGFVIKVVNSLTDGAFSVGSVQGRLATNFILENLHLETSGADIDIVKFQWSWNPLSILKGKLDVTTAKTTKLLVQLKESEPYSEENKDGSSLPLIFPPFQLQVGELSFDDIQIKGTDGSVAFQLFTFTAGFDYRDGVVAVDSFNAEGPEIGLSFHGNVELQKSQNLDLMGNWRLVGYGFHPSKGTFSLKGPVDSLGVTVSLNDPGEIHVVGVVKDLLGNATWTAGLDAKNVNIETWILHCPAIILSTVHADMSGDFGHYRGLIEADGVWGVADNLRLRTDIDGDGLGIVFSSLRLDRNESSAVATDATISWAELFSWEAGLAFDNFVLDMFFPEFKGSVSSHFHSVGDVTEEGLVATLDLADMTGDFDGYTWSAVGNVSLTEERIFTRDLRIRSDSVGGLALVRDAELSWAHNLSWQADVDLDHFDPGFLHPMAVGDISGNVISKFEWNEDLPSGTLDFSQLSGTLRGTDISGGGRVTIDGTELSTTGLLLSLGESQLLVTGQMEEALGLQFSFDSPDLSVIGENLQGTLSVHGQVSGSKDSPSIDLDLAGTDLQLNSESVRVLSGHLKTSFASDSAIDGALVLEDSLIKGVNLTKADVAVTGTLLAHNITGEIWGPDGKLDLSLTGKYEKGWQGTLAGLNLKTKRYGEWTQLDAADMTLSPDVSRLQGFCLAHTAARESSSSCISAKIDSAEEMNWSIDAAIIGLELEHISDMDLGLPPINGDVNASLEANGNRSGVAVATVSVIIPEVDTLLNVTDSDFVSVQLRDSVLKAHLEENQLSFNLHFRANKGGTLDLSGQIHGVGLFDTPLTSRTVVGKLSLDKYYLSSLAAFTGYGVEPTGWVSSSFDIGGTVAKPELYGELAIQEGGLELPYQGITLENVVISVDSKESEAVVRAKADSDGGRLEVGGYIKHSQDGVEGDLHITGEDFLLVNLPEYSFRVTPDARLKINQNRGELKGKVVVLSGLIAPEELSGAVQVSEDVVFLGEEKTHVKKGYPFFLDLDVKLGDDVNVDGYGLKGRLGGELRVKITPDDFITGKGELDLIDSTFTFYGRSLEIARGRMLFTEGPIDNPGVDIRAQKVISAKTALDDGYTVGVDINGLVQDLQFHLFSDPYMEDADILSQMVVGHSFASSSEEEGTLLRAAAMTLGFEGSSKLMKGISGLLLIDDLHLEGSTQKEDVSLVVGKRITEDLYIGYDMNMFSQLGQFRVRYDLSRGFFVETRSSSESTGADLIYTFEK
ncbi:MAG: translocation and assembly module TamB [Desulforhopalus sp.]|jgi:translocation and assembly module TamB